MFCRYFNFRPDDFDTPNGIRVDWWDTGKALIDMWMKRGI